MRQATNQEAKIGQTLVMQRLYDKDYFVVTHVLNKKDEYGNTNIIVKLVDGQPQWKYYDASSQRLTKRSQPISMFELA